MNASGFHPQYHTRKRKWVRAGMVVHTYGQARRLGQEDHHDYMSGPHLRKPYKEIGL